jgi:hypothetical protein
MKGKVLFVVLVALFLTDLVYGQGCSQCKLVAEQGALDEDSFGSNINSGILILMTLPYILLFAIFHRPIIRFFKKRFQHR